MNGPQVPEWFLGAHERLAVRLAEGGGHEDPDDPATVWAMPLVLRLPKDPYPPRGTVLEAAAAATAAICLNEQAAPGGRFAAALDAWCDARIRKVARRARSGRWEAAAALPGVTAEAGDGPHVAAVRAFPPTRVDEVPAALRRLQIGGTELPDALRVARLAEAVPGTAMLWVDEGLEMTVGKAAAQVGHAAMLLAGALAPVPAWAWARSGFPCRVRAWHADDLDDLRARLTAGNAVAVTDAGYTEVAPGSVTVIATPP